MDKNLYMKLCFVIELIIDQAQLKKNVFYTPLNLVLLLNWTMKYTVMLRYSFHLSPIPFHLSSIKFLVGTKVDIVFTRKIKYQS